MLPISEQDAENEEHVLVEFGSEIVAQALNMEQRHAAVLQMVELIPYLIKEAENAPTLELRYRTVQNVLEVLVSAQNEWGPVYQDIHAILAAAQDIPEVFSFYERFY